MDTVVYAARLKDKEKLMKSSSGGMFRAISDFFLKQEWAVVCSRYNYELQKTECSLVTTADEQDKAIGSKYMQSDSGNVYIKAIEWLKNNPQKKLLFVGMGCQAAGFRKFSELNNFRERVIIVDIICHGAVSPGFWKNYADTLGKFDYLTFKDKRNGWIRPTAFVRKGEKEIFLNDYIKIFYNHSALRPSCYQCPYATVERQSDITIGDYWGIDKVMPDFYSFDGNSLVLIHTEAGVDVWNKITAELEWRESNVEDCLQPNLIKPTERPVTRERFWNEYQQFGIKYIMKKYGSIPMKSRIKSKIKKVVKSLLPM